MMKDESNMEEFLRYADKQAYADTRNIREKIKQDCQRLSLGPRGKTLTQLVYVRRDRTIDPLKELEGAIKQDPAKYTTGDETIRNMIN